MEFYPKKLKPSLSQWQSDMLSVIESKVSIAYGNYIFRIGSVSLIVIIYNEVCSNTNFKTANEMENIRRNIKKTIDNRIINNHNILPNIDNVDIQIDKAENALLDTVRWVQDIELLTKGD